METKRDLLHAVDGRTPAAQRSMNALRLFGAMLAIAAILAFSMRPNHSNASATVGAVAYCVTVDGSPAKAGLNTALYTTGGQQLQFYSAGKTDAHGCGVFNYVPVSTLFFVTAFSAEGDQVGNSAWFETDAMTIAPTVQLDTPGFYNRLALH